MLNYSSLFNNKNKMRNLVFIIILLSLTSFKADLSGLWNRVESENVTVYSRPADYSKTNSPDSTDLQRILMEQNQIIDLINRRLKTDFNGMVEIYLFNYDEAKEKIGTNGGGFCSTKKSRIYFTYYDDPIYNTIRKEREYMGVHEMVHLIANKELGDHKTAFFAEGYANAIDGNYGAINNGDSLTRRRIDSTMNSIVANGKMSTPAELLHNTDIPAQMFYPQIGCLFNWLFAEYGIDRINEMYTFSTKQIEKNFEKITGDSFEEMERKYLLHIKNE